MKIPHPESVMYPRDGGLRVCLHGAVELDGQAVLLGVLLLLTPALYERRELHLQGDVSPGGLAHAVVGHAEVGAAVLLLHLVDLQDLAWGQEEIRTCRKMRLEHTRG